ncbi:MAG: ISAs1 family transposase, partial [Gammaproteobacteria bacterium]
GITADVLRTQRKSAVYLVAERQAHYHFTVDGNQPHLFEEIVVHFEDPQEPGFVDNSSLEHGRIEIRKIWTTSALNGYLDLPHLRQAFAIDRETI